MPGADIRFHSDSTDTEQCVCPFTPPGLARGDPMICGWLLAAHHGASEIIMPVLWLRRWTEGQYLFGDELLKAPQVAIADPKLFQFRDGLKEILCPRANMTTRPCQDLRDARQG